MQQSGSGVQASEGIGGDLGRSDRNPRTALVRPLSAASIRTGVSGAGAIVDF
jgi:hypothetical protein